MADRRVITFLYKDHRGEVATRRVLPIRVWFGATAYHREGCWLLEAFCLDHQETRDFSMSVEHMLSGWETYQEALPLTSKG